MIYFGWGKILNPCPSFIVALQVLNPSHSSPFTGLFFRVHNTGIGKLRDVIGWFLPYSPKAGCVPGFAIGKSDNHRGRIYAAVEVGGVLISDVRGKTWELNPTDSTDSSFKKKCFLLQEDGLNCSDGFRSITMSLSRNDKPNGRPPGLIQLK
jgi:hypothetical protein